MDTVCGLVFAILAGIIIWVVYWLWIMGAKDDSSDD